MLAEAQAAREVVDRLSAEPRGVVRASVPVSLAQMQLPKLLPKFLEQYPKVRLQLNISNRRVDIINEGYDVALRVRSRLDDDGSLVMRSFGQVQELLVASPKYLDRAGRPRTRKSSPSTSPSASAKTKHASAGNCMARKAKCAGSTCSRAWPVSTSRCCRAW